jgi:signal peptidase I
MEINTKKSKISLGEFSSRVLPMLEENIDVALTTTGNSMYPLWKHKRDKVVLTSCDKFSLKKGDIPLYKRVSGQYVLHRIVKVNDDSYDMCGDAQVQIEYNLPKQNIIAVVKSFTRKGKDYSCNYVGFRIYSAVWLWLLPFRRISLKIYKKLSGILK